MALAGVLHGEPPVAAPGRVEPVVAVPVLLEGGLPLAEDEDRVAVLRQGLLVEHVDEGVAGVPLDDLAKDWLQKALAYTDGDCRGALGPLTRIWPRPGDPTALEPTYRLADYLEQTGRTARAATYPPSSFWDSAISAITDPNTLHAFASWAYARGRFSRAAAFYGKAADRGDTDALWLLAHLREKAGDQEGAAAAAREAANRGHDSVLPHLARLREQAGDREGAAMLYREAADRGDTYALLRLADLRQQAGDQEGAAAAALEAADRGDSLALLQPAELRRQVNDAADADKIRRFSLTDCGHPATSLG